jgi:hypothetical protein
LLDSPQKIDPVTSNNEGQFEKNTFVSATAGWNFSKKSVRTILSKQDLVMFCLSLLEGHRRCEIRSG